MLQHLFTKPQYTLTENGALAYNSSGNALIDLFFNVNVLKEANQDFQKLLAQAMKENEELATKIMLYSRDARGGAGRRVGFQWFCKQIVKEYDYSKVLNDKILELGYWKDVFVLFKSVKNKEAYFNVLKEYLDDGLFCKWFPRNGKLFHEFSVFLNLRYKELRKLLVKNTNVVETKMCAGKWEEINYAHVPSKAGLFYRDVFVKHDADRYNAYIKDVNEGKAKINASVLTPTDIFQQIFNKGLCNLKNEADFNVFQTLWDNLPKEFSETDISILPIIDCSGSMFCNNNIPISASVGLGLFIAQNNKGGLQNKFINFSSVPTVFDITGKSLCDICTNTDMFRNWGMTTNISAVYDLILNSALLSGSVPSHLLILSDMQFDRSGAYNTPFEEYRAKFAEKGLKMPKVIFWNLAAHTAFPATKDDDVLLVSGYSSKLAEEIIRTGNVDALNFVKNLVDKDKYILRLS